MVIIAWVFYLIFMMVLGYRLRRGVAKFLNYNVGVFKDACFSICPTLSLTQVAKELEFGKDVFIV